LEEEDIMENKTDKLYQFFEQVKTLTFWKRIFGWAQFRTLSYDAYQEFNSLLSQTIQLAQESTRAKSEILVLNNDNGHLKEKQNDLEKELSAVKEKVNSLSVENTQLSRENISFRQTGNDRITKYQNDVAALNSIREQIQNDRKNEISKQQEKEIEKLTRQKEGWAKHEESVREAIKAICQKHIIEYVERVPFKGSPDNTVKICDEFVIFDAKSPGSDDLSNFHTYIKSQTDCL
jgi:predicted  nucleic acid-binding Zn-ribbon protein